MYYRMIATKERPGMVPYESVALKGWTRRHAPENMGRKNGEFVVRGGWVWEKPADPKMPGSKVVKLVEWEIPDLPENLGAEKKLLKGSWVDVKKIHEEVAAGWIVRK